jgi:hypothetical protein
MACLRGWSARTPSIHAPPSFGTCHHRRRPRRRRRSVWRPTPGGKRPPRWRQLSRVRRRRTRLGHGGIAAMAGSAVLQKREELKTSVSVGASRLPRPATVLSGDGRQSLGVKTLAGSCVTALVWKRTSSIVMVAWFVRFSTRQLADAAEGERFAPGSAPDPRLAAGTEPMAADVLYGIRSAKISSF